MVSECDAMRDETMRCAIVRYVRMAGGFWRRDTMSAGGRLQSNFVDRAWSRESRRRIGTVDQISGAREVEGDGRARRGSGWISWTWISSVASGRASEMQRNAMQSGSVVRFSVPGLESSRSVWLARDRRQSWQLE